MDPVLNVNSVLHVEETVVSSQYDFAVLTIYDLSLLSENVIFKNDVNLIHTFKIGT